ncbi:translation initiation factor 5B [Mytilus galloprovincialis]|uniref:Eukaryotic translation initiation factor 5B n=1 Tax=Mytilus galloprovincialis TaxID=29158 RepID=A0A8B6FYB2_MYTGA|nr:translation initiation factor 5B [Mytilus galloprovincialis]
MSEAGYFNPQQVQQQFIQQQMNSQQNYPNDISKQLNNQQSVQGQALAQQQNMSQQPQQRTPASFYPQGPMQPPQQQRMKILGEGQSPMYPTVMFMPPTTNMNSYGTQIIVQSQPGVPMKPMMLPDDERMAAPKPPYNMPAQQTVSSRGYSGMPPTSYQNTMTMNPVPTQRPPSEPGMTAPQPKIQKRERKILSIIDPNTGKDLISDVISSRSTPPKSTGSRGQSPTESIELPTLSSSLGQQTVSSGGYGGMPPTSYQNRMTMYPVPTQRHPSAPGMSAPQPKIQKRERKNLYIVDPNTGKDIISDVISSRSTPPGSTGSGSRGQTPTESIEERGTSPPQGEEASAICAQFAAQVDATMRSGGGRKHPALKSSTEVLPGVQPHHLKQTVPVMEPQSQPPIVMKDTTNSISQQQPIVIAPHVSASQPLSNRSAQQTVSSGGYSGMPPTSYQNTMHPVPKKRPPSAPGITAPQPFTQKRERKILYIVDPDTGKDIISDVMSTRSTPPASTGSGSRGRTPNEIIEFQKAELKLPGMLIIDTPGHESFSNLRSRGSSLCDMAILVVDIMHGLEPQTIESINLLKQRKTPFVIALNKIDRLYQWKPMPQTDVSNVIKKQTNQCKSEFDERARMVVTQMAEQGLNTALFYENKNPKEFISLIPTSAHSGDGMGNLIALICTLCQTLLAKRLAYSEELHATAMEVKALPGLGTTVDVILVNGKLKEGDTVIVPGTEGPIVTQIRGLLMPQPMKELRVKSQWEHHKEVKAAQGVKIIAKDLDHALAGLPVYSSNRDDEIEYYKEELSVALKEVLGSIRLAERGVFVQASTLGSMEALLEFLRTSKIPYAGINIGPVHKKDIMKASVMLEHDSQYAVILAFDVKVEREAQDLADSLNVTIFTADIIYHLFDKFIAYRDELKKKRQEEFKHIAVFPCKLRVLPNCIFNSRDPIVCGVSVESGFVKVGTPICVPSQQVSCCNVNNL